MLYHACLHPSLKPLAKGEKGSYTTSTEVCTLVARDSSELLGYKGKGKKKKKKLVPGACWGGSKASEICCNAPVMSSV